MALPIFSLPMPSRLDDYLPENWSPGNSPPIPPPSPRDNPGIFILIYCWPCGPPPPNPIGGTFGFPWFGS